MTKDYRNFEIEIETIKQMDCRAKLIKSDIDVHSKFILSEDISTLEHKLAGLLMDRNNAIDTSLVKNQGSTLFNSLFSREMYAEFDKLREITESNYGSIRMGLRLREPVFEKIPWEYLYDEHHDFLAFKYSIARIPSSPIPKKPLLITSPIKILGFISETTDSPSLQADTEKAEIENILSSFRDQVKIEWVKGNRWIDLQEKLGQNDSWHIFHFIGHSILDGASGISGILLGDDHNRIKLYKAEDFARLVGSKSSIRLVILNSCEGARSNGYTYFSSAASQLIRCGVSAVVAMQYNISNEMSHIFSRTFYRVITQNETIDEAIRQSRLALLNTDGNGYEWGIPTLYIQCKDGILFHMDRTNNKTDLQLDYSMRGESFDVNVQHLPDLDYTTENREINYEQQEKELARQEHLELEQKIRSLEEDLIKALVARADINFQLGNLDAVIQDYDHILFLRPYEADFYNQRGLIWSDYKSHKDALINAINDYSKAIELRPGYAEYYWNRGLAYTELEDWKAAEQELSILKKIARGSNMIKSLERTIQSMKV